MITQNVTSLDGFEAVVPTVEDKSAEVMIAGNPSTQTWLFTESPDGKMFTGVWQSEAVRFRKRQNGETEYCHILKGMVRLTDGDGRVSTFNEGEGFTVGPDFDGEWESIGRVRKHFVVYAP